MNWFNYTEQELVDIFAQTFHVDARPIIDADYFKLCYLCNGYGAIFGACNSLDEFRKAVLCSLISFYNEKVNAEFEYERDWAKETANKIQEIFKYGEINE